MTITYLQRKTREKVLSRATYIISNTECCPHYGSSTRLKKSKGTIAEVKLELSNSGNLQDWYITADYILGEDGATKKVHIIQSNVKFVPIPIPPPDLQYQNEIAQERNVTPAVFAVVLDD